MDSNQPTGPKDPLDPAHWVDRHGDCLFRYALLRLRDAALAEDMVQETFLTALRSREHFAGKSSERTWLVGILKHKLIDHIRRQSRERPLPAGDASGGPLEELFDEKGRWKNRPVQGPGDPSTALEQKEFWEVFRRCLSTLPQRWADAFSLREMEGLSSDQACKVLNVSATNLWVLLHRARLRLWRCLETNWFGTKAQRP
ncbi:MAG: sigma-70 family RNA polymerase sigma factor [Planctomycetes bacterium]|nr:sigma-70 family RNA polymerase sigma factor [Planctomycetota bacterium]